MNPKSFLVALRRGISPATWTALIICCQLWFALWVYQQKVAVLFPTSSRRLLVSISTMPQRKNELILTLKSIFRQTLLPSQILINFANDSEYPSDEIKEKISRISMQSNHRRPVVHFQACDPKWRSCAKLLGALAFIGSEVSNRSADVVLDEPNIVYADDDTIYPDRWLESLVAGSYYKPGCAIGLLTIRRAIISWRPHVF